MGCTKRFIEAHSDPLKHIFIQGTDRPTLSELVFLYVGGMGVDWLGHLPHSRGPGFDSRLRPLGVEFACSSRG